MANFTPINPKKISNKSLPKKKFNLLLWGNLIMVVLIAVIGILYYNQTLQTTKQKAAGVKCSTIDNQKDCNAACSPPKANGLAYKCKWLSNQGCIESSNLCGSNLPPTSGDCNFPAGLPEVCKQGDCCVPADTTTGNPQCIGLGPRMTTCAKGYVCVWGRGCFPPTQPPRSNPTNTPTPTPTTPRSTNTPTPTTPRSTNTPTPTTPGSTNTPTPTTPGSTDTPTPTEIIIVQATNTPIQNSPTSTPVQQIAQTGDIRSSWVFAVPIGVILLGLLL
ncbi:MAG: hypothetical protein Fur009_6440 [Candidatus Microgenomates bacterium]